MTKAIAKKIRKGIHFELKEDEISEIGFEPYAQDGTNCYLVAIQSGNVYWLQQFLQYGAAYRKQYATTGVHEAVIHGQLKILELLVDDYQCSVHVHTTRGMTPFMYACKNNQLTMIPILMKAGAIVNERNQMGLTGFYLACKHGHLDMVQLLAETHHANINLGSHLNHTPLHIAISNGHCTIASYLLNCSTIDKNPIDTTGVSIWHQAAGFGHLPICKLLLALNLLPMNVDTIRQRHPFHYAAMEGHSEIVAFFIENNLISSIDITDEDDCTAIYYASSNGHYRTLQVLLFAGGNPNISSIHRSPLQSALDWNHLDCVSILRKHLGKIQNEGL